MPTTLETIQQLHSWAAMVLPKPATLAQKSKLADTVEELRKRFSSLTERQPVGVDLEDLHTRLSRAVRFNNFAHISKRDWRRAPWIFWWKQKTSLAEFPQFMQAYEEFMRRNSGSGPVKTLIYVYLRNFPDLPSRVQVARLIQNRLYEDDRSTLLTWRQRHKEFALFDPMEGPRQVAIACLAPGAIDTTMNNIGLTGQLAQGAFVKVAYCHVLMRLRSQLERGDPQAPLERTINWSKNQDGGLRYPDRKGVLAETLLLPWQDRHPENLVKDRIQTFLLQTLKDPRIFPSNWQGIDENAVAVLRRWLVGATLKQFFDILDRNAQYYPDNHRRHWHYRRAFWWAYYQRGYLLEAWFAFAPEAELLACQVLETEERIYAKLIGSSDKKHSALIMRIGELTIAEWSHNGKCQIWRQDYPKAPRLYEQRYERGQLVRGSEWIESSQKPGIVHRSSESGHWQATVEEFIYRHSNIRIPKRDYMPH